MTLLGTLTEKQSCHTGNEESARESMMHNEVFKSVTACWSADASQRSADKSARRVVQWSRLVCCGLRTFPVDMVMQMKYIGPIMCPIVRY